MYCAWRFGGQDPYELYNGPGVAPCPQPFRLRAFYYAMAHYAREEYLKVHNVHPSQHKSGPGAGTEIVMPGGVTGVKR